MRNQRLWRLMCGKAMPFRMIPLNVLGLCPPALEPQPRVDFERIFAGKAKPYRTSGGKATSFRGAKHYRVLDYLVNSTSAAMWPKLAHWMPSTIWRKVFSASVRRPL